MNQPPGAVHSPSVSAVYLFDARAHVPGGPGNPRGPGDPIPLSPFSPGNPKRGQKEKAQGENYRELCSFHLN